MKTLLQQNSPNLLVVEQGSIKDCDLYLDILNVRNEAFDYDDKFKLVYPIDSYSDHYRLTVDGKTAGALSVTQTRNGVADCEEYMPQCLLDNFRDMISSACKFRIVKQKIAHIEKRSQINLPQQVIKMAFKDQLSKGIKLDIINARKSFARYYRQMGYLTVENSEFIHPVLGTNSVIMYLPADPNHKSLVQQSCKSLDNHLLLSEVQRVLTRTSVFYSRDVA